MRRFVLAVAGMFAVCAAWGQEGSRFHVSTALGTGVALNEPASVPAVWRVTGNYAVSPRFSVGIGSGVSVYEKALVPLFAEAGMLLTRPRRVTPYVGFAGGYAFAPSREAKGGAMFSPAVGVRCTLRGRGALFLEAGCEWQRLERLREYEGRYLSAAFAEKLRHTTLLLKIGFLL